MSTSTSSRHRAVIQHPLTNRVLLVSNGDKTKNKRSSSSSSSLSFQCKAMIVILILVGVANLKLANWNPVPTTIHQQNQNQRPQQTTPAADTVNDPPPPSILQKYQNRFLIPPPPKSTSTPMTTKNTATTATTRTTSSVIINIGSNIDPILPRQEDGPCALSIAVEPVVAKSIPFHPQLVIVPAAVSNTSGTVQMQIYNSHGVSSSIHKANDKFKWAHPPPAPGTTETTNENNKKNGNTQQQQQQNAAAAAKTMNDVPMVSLTQLLQSIPDEIPIKLLMTDMQGHDFVAVSSAMDEILRRQIPFLRTEVSLDGSYSYEGAQNDLCRDWIPFMMRKSTMNTMAMMNTNNNNNSRSSSSAKTTERPQDYYIFEGLYPARNSKKGWENASQILERCQEQRIEARDPWVGLKELDALWRLLPKQTISNNNDNNNVPIIVNADEAYQYPVHSTLRQRPNKHLKAPTFTKEEYERCSK